MADFKDVYSHDLIAAMGDRLAGIWPAFDRDGFVIAATRDLACLEFKQRADQITAALAACLPGDFDQAVEMLLASLAPEEEGTAYPTGGGAAGIAGWAVLPMTLYVGEYGQRHFKTSMTALKAMTKRFSAEFGIRYFLRADPVRSLATLDGWVGDPCRHVRRLVSEGTRPRLPWAMRLPDFVADPTPLLPLLDTLKDDRAEEVRRSVANNLNDIAKDHPDLVATTAGQWMAGAGPERRKLVRHALRSLVKQGHQGAFEVLGYRPAAVAVRALRITTPTVVFGGTLEFELALESRGQDDQKLIVDYAIHHQKANGRRSPKVFKWKRLILPKGGKITAARRHPLVPITTRRYYPGRHLVEVLVNGHALGRAAFTLEMPG